MTMPNSTALAKYAQKQERKNKAYLVGSKYMGNIAPIQVKTYVLGPTTSPFADAGTVAAIVLNGMARGTSSSTRTGRQIEMLKFDITGNIFIPPVAGPISWTTTFCRIIVTWDYGTNGLAPAYSDLVKDSTALTNWIGAINPDINKRTLVLWDEIRMFGPGSMTTSLVTEYSAVDPVWTSPVISICKEIPQLPTVFNSGTTSVPASINCGMLGLWLVASTNAVYSAKWSCELKFVG